MSFYEIYHPSTKQLWRGWASSYKEACQRLGWRVEDCVIQALASTFKTTEDMGG